MVKLNVDEIEARAIAAGYREGVAGALLEDVAALVAEVRLLRAPAPERDEARRLQEARIAADLASGQEAKDALVAAIRAITVEAPDDRPNGPAEQALLDLEKALDPRVGCAGLNAAREAAAALCEALADDTRALRIAAEAYFGGDFRAPQEGAR